MMNELRESVAASHKQRTSILTAHPLMEKVRDHQAEKLQPHGEDDTITWTKIKQGIRRVFNPEARTEWFGIQLKNGLDEGMLLPEEEQDIRSQMHDPYIQLYLKCLAVHVCMLPTTYIVLLIFGVIYELTHPGETAQNAKIIAAMAAFFAFFPMSPGSLARGLYVLCVIIAKRSFHNLKVALFFSFWRYVGYLAFPLQTAASLPALSRFLATRWATHTVHMIPRLGIRGGLLEYRVFDMFFNLPLSLGRLWKERKIRR